MPEDWIKNIPKEYLIDTSTFISAFAEGNEPARKLIQSQTRVYYIEQLKLEITNVALNKGLSAAGADSLRANLLEKRFMYLPNTEVDYTTGYRIAQHTGAAIYDAMFHAAALKLYLTFLTMDRKYYEKAKHIGYIELAPGA